MKKFLDYVVGSLIPNSENISICEHTDEHKNSIELRVSRAEMGKLIGKQGQMADALRTISSFYGKKVLKKSVSFHIVEK